ncbi:MAG: DUF192 domain-containing protein [Lentisphaeria bacterium]|nr:DUF192 domain-containing protein [Lentisphaeria bacterium]
MLLFWAAVALRGWCGAVGEASPRTLPVLIGEVLFELEVAATPAARERGLMGRASVPHDGGMLFVYPSQQPSLAFWMKNTLVDLDIVYLDAAARVVSTAVMRAEPARRPEEPEDAYEQRLPLYPSAGPAQYAIEFKAGTLDLLRLRQGDRIALDTVRLTGLAR